MKAVRIEQFGGLDALFRIFPYPSLKREKLV
jgi:hypothetical protein